MNTFYNRAILKERRQILRKNQTSTEGGLWFHLRSRRMHDEKFYRQYSVGPYILDFYCPKKKLAIEVDGSQHYEKENKEYDQTRTEFLSKQNIKVLRFTNLDILNYLFPVCEVIYQELEKS